MKNKVKITVIATGIASALSADDPLFGMTAMQGTQAANLQTQLQQAAIVPPPRPAIPVVKNVVAAPAPQAIAEPIAAAPQMVPQVAAQPVTQAVSMNVQQSAIIQPQPISMVAAQVQAKVLEEPIIAQPQPNEGLAHSKLENMALERFLDDSELDSFISPSQPKAPVKEEILQSQEELFPVERPVVQQPAAVAPATSIKATPPKSNYANELARAQQIARSLGVTNLSDDEYDIPTFIRRQQQSNTVNN